MKGRQNKTKRVQTFTIVDIYTVITENQLPCDQKEAAAQIGCLFHSLLPFVRQFLDHLAEYKQAAVDVAAFFESST